MKVKKTDAVGARGKLRDYQEKLMQDLQDPVLASEYLNASLQDEDPRVFLLALKNVCEAQGAEMASLSRKANVSRENLYRILSKRGNPKLTSIVSVLDAVGFSLAVSPHLNKR